MSNLPINRQLSCVARSLSGMPALVTPASTEITTMQGAPVGKLFEITFSARYPTLAEGDLLVADGNPTERYRVKGTQHWDTRFLNHTYCLAETGLV